MTDGDGSTSRPSGGGQVLVDITPKDCSILFKVSLSHSLLSLVISRRGREWPVMSTPGLPRLFLKEFGAIDYCLFPLETYRGWEFWNWLEIKGTKYVLRFLFKVSRRNVALLINSAPAAPGRRVYSRANSKSRVYSRVNSKPRVNSRNNPVLNAGKSAVVPRAPRVFE